MILAIDYGRLTGWALGNGERGLWVLGPEGPDNAGVRLRALYDNVCRICDRVEVTKIAAEDAAYGGQNQFYTAMGQSEMRGILRLIAASRGAAFHLVNPSTWKSWLTGSPRADKQQVIRSIELIYKVRLVDDNTADAFAILKCAEAGVTRLTPEKVKKPRDRRKPGSRKRPDELF